MRVAQVPGPYLRAHVPAVEGGRREADSSRIQHHIRDGWKRVPPQPHVFEPLQLRVLEVHYEDKLFRDVVVADPFSRRGQNQWKDVECTSFALPAESLTHLGQKEGWRFICNEKACICVVKISICNFRFMTLDYDLVKLLTHREFRNYLVINLNIFLNVSTGNFIFLLYVCDGFLYFSLKMKTGILNC